MNNGFKVSVMMFAVMCTSVHAATNTATFWRKPFDNKFDELFVKSTKNILNPDFNFTSFTIMFDGFRETVKKDFSQFDDAFSTLDKAIDLVLLIPQSFVNTCNKNLKRRDTGSLETGKEVSALIMLTYKDWVELTDDVLSEMIDDARKSFGNASQMLEKKKFMEKEEVKDMRGLLQHVIERFKTEAIKRIIQDFNKFREDVKKAQYQSYKQASFVGKKIDVIEESRFKTAEDKWDLMMNEIGFKKDATLKDATKKFEYILNKTQGDITKNTDILLVITTLTETYEAKIKEEAMKKKSSR